MTPLEQEAAWMRTALGAAQHQLDRERARVEAARWVVDAAEAFLDVEDPTGTGFMALRQAIEAFKRS